MTNTWSKYLPWVVFATAAIRRLATCTESAFWGSWADDLWYYIKVAENILLERGSTFDGITPTNGYHPLWMGVLLAILRISGGLYPLLIVLALVIAASTAVTFEMARRMIAKFVGTDGLFAWAGATATAVYFYVVAKHGMEVVLTVPLMLVFLWRVWTNPRSLSEPKSLILTGLVASAVILSRLDSLMYVALFAVAYVAYEGFSPKVVVPRGLYFAIGLLPVAGYALFNSLLFDGPLPVSGAAKQLVEAPFIQFGWRDYQVSRGIHYALIYPSAALVFVGLVTALVRTGKVERRALFLAVLPTLVFPFVFQLVQTSLSDWPIWDWYLYPYIAATPIAIGVVGHVLQTQHDQLDHAVAKFRYKAWIPGAVCAIFLVSAAFPWAGGKQKKSMQEFAEALIGFSESHPGRYAMGDRAGIVGIMLQHPLVQLEGLVGDRRFLENIKRRRNLVEVLAEYDVDYYVTSAFVKRCNCYETFEPQKAGPYSPKMAGVFCQRPAMVFRTRENVTSVVFSLKSHDQVNKELAGLATKGSGDAERATPVR